MIETRGVTLGNERARLVITSWQASPVKNWVFSAEGSDERFGSTYPGRLGEGTPIYLKVSTVLLTALQTRAIIAAIPCVHGHQSSFQGNQLLTLQPTVNVRQDHRETGRLP